MKKILEVYEFGRSVTFTLRGLWLHTFLNLICGVIFLFLDEGRDVLRCVAEDCTGINKGLAPFFSLLISVALWSVLHEFVTRVTLYLTDNSGFTISNDEVVLRKKIQAWAPKIFLFFPFVLMTSAFIVVGCKTTDHNSGVEKASYFIAVLFIIAGIILGYKTTGKNYFFNPDKHPDLKEWLTRLYGIFGELRFDVSVSESNDHYEKIFGENAKIQNHDDFVKLDHNLEILINGTLLPKGLCESLKISSQQVGGTGTHTVYTWVFKQSAGFYSWLNLRVKIVTLLSLVMALFFVVCAHLQTYNYLGAAAILSSAVAIWPVAHLFVVYYYRKGKAGALSGPGMMLNVIPWRLVLMILFFLSTFYGVHHRVRKICKLNENAIGRRPELSSHFKSWADSLANDKSRYYYLDTNNACSPKDSLPVVFIAAEGGALRTGAFSALTLAHIEKQLPGFSKHIYCYSSVSGGSLGVHFFNSRLLAEKTNGHPESDSVRIEKIKIFFKTDFLAPVISRMVFGEIVNYFLFGLLPNQDRAIALEESWETAWGECDSLGKLNLFKEPFGNSIGSRQPACFINTTEVETGRQCFWSNVRVDKTKDFPLGKERDLYARYPKHSLAYSTAIGLSTRFPLISPAAEFIDSSDNNLNRHYVDGGYFENKGVETLLQVLKALHLNENDTLNPYAPKNPIKPYIIVLNSAETDDSTKQASGKNVPKSVNAFNEISEIGTGLINTRAGHGDIAMYNLAEYRPSINAELIQLAAPIKSDVLPVNWVLSDTAVNQLNEEIPKVLKKAGVKEKFKWSKK